MKAQLPVIAMCGVFALALGACVPGADIPGSGSNTPGPSSTPGQQSPGGQTPAPGGPSNPGAQNPSNPGTTPPLNTSSLRIVALGDSLTEGNGDDTPTGSFGYPGRVLDRFQATRPDTTVVNFGHSGWTSDHLINGTDGTPSELVSALAEKPNVACVWIGSNDLWYLYSGGPVSTDLESADLAHYTQNIETILSRLTAAGARVFIALNDDQSKRPISVKQVYFPDMNAAAQAQMSAQVVRYNNAITTLAQKYGATVVDFYHTTFFTNPVMLSNDDVHPNSAGYDLVAALWLAAMEPALK